jgi:hypothetical protein
MRYTAVYGNDNNEYEFNQVLFLVESNPAESEMGMPVLHTETLPYAKQTSYTPSFHKCEKCN